MLFYTAEESNKGKKIESMILGSVLSTIYHSICTSMKQIFCLEYNLRIPISAEQLEKKQSDWIGI